MIQKASHEVLELEDDAFAVRASSSSWKDLLHSPSLPDSSFFGPPDAEHANTHECANLGGMKGALIFEVFCAAFLLNSKCVLNPLCSVFVS